jgi:hypothetical protein
VLIEVSESQSEIMRHPAHPIIRVNHRTPAG